MALGWQVAFVIARQSGRPAIFRKARYARILQVRSPLTPTVAKCKKPGLSGVRDKALSVLALYSRRAEPSVDASKSRINLSKSRQCYV